jgi:exopolyphosphatase
MSASAPLRVSAGLLEFLAHSRRALLSPPLPHPPLHLVLGNEACDADSVVSAIAHAYWLHAERPPFLPAAALVAPVVSCRRAEWPLRREAASLLAEALLGPSPRGAGGSPTEAASAALGEVLTFLDDAAPAVAAARAAAAPVRATLADHNRLDGGGAALGLRDADVAEIVDHHEDMGAHAHVAGAARTVAYDAAARKGVGSACTIVAAALLRRPPPPGGGGQPPLLDAPLARLLLGVVLLDTCGLAPAAGKATGEDLRVAAALRERGGVGEAEGGALYDSLAALRFEPAFWRALPPAVALAYDYKGFGAFGSAAICEPAAAFLGVAAAGGGELRGAPLAACAAAAAGKGHALFLLLSMAPGGARAGEPFSRQLAAVVAPRGARGGARARAALARLRACPLLRLEELAAGRTEDGWEGVLFQQGNVVASRKQVVPLVQGWLELPAEGGEGGPEGGAGEEGRAPAEK